MNQLASVNLILQSTSRDDLPRHISGQLARVAFLDGLQQVHPAFFDVLTQSNHAPKPFTVSRLNRMYSDKSDYGYCYRLRITTLHPQLTMIMVNGLIPLWVNKGVCLNDTVLDVIDVQVDEKINPWTGATSFEDLLLSAPSTTQLTLQFVSPTAFKKTGGQWVRLPESPRIFGSLLQRWNTFAPMRMPDDMINEFENCIEITSHDIRTRSIPAENQRTVKGFVGGVTFRVLNDNPLFLQYVNALAQFAKYSGIGTRTTIGLGQARVI